DADPEAISAGEALQITLQPYETPGKPVIIPDQTYVNLQTNLLGDLIGGLGLPELGTCDFRCAWQLPEPV
ncbi:MAG TPA: hypothetical protein VJ964_08775, partial [Balneolaceae bacterium]|nr:hypothetical protein [Balneolaceae bacterium]